MALPPSRGHVREPVAPGLMNPGAWMTRARQFVTRQGWQGADRDDLVQEMALQALTRASRTHDFSLMYLRARDRLDPRIHKASGKLRVTQLVRTDGWQTARRQPIATDEVQRMDSLIYLKQVCRVLAPAVQVWFLRLIWEGWTLTEVATAAGITQSAMTHRMRRVQAQLRPFV